MDLWLPFPLNTPSARGGNLASGYAKDCWLRVLAALQWTLWVTRRFLAWTVGSYRWVLNSEASLLAGIGSTRDECLVYCKPTRAWWTFETPGVCFQLHFRVLIHRDRLWFVFGFVFGFSVFGFRFSVSAFSFRSSAFGFRFSVFGFRLSVFNWVLWLWVCAFRCRFRGDGFKVYGLMVLGCVVLGSGLRVDGVRVFVRV